MNRHFAPEAPSEELLHRDDHFAQALTPRPVQINRDASRVLGTATIKNAVSYGEHSNPGNQFIPVD